MIGTLSRLQLIGDLSLSFALFGALHAVALVLAVRVRHSLWKKCLFIILAAALSVLTFLFASVGGKLFGASPGKAGLHGLLGVSAVVGAASYGTLIRLFRMHALTIGELAAIAAGCMVGAFVGLFTARHSQALGPWWIAVLWWFAFSGGLYCFDARNHPRSGVR